MTSLVEDGVDFERLCQLAATREYRVELWASDTVHRNVQAPDASFRRIIELRITNGKDQVARQSIYGIHDLDRGAKHLREHLGWA